MADSACRPTGSRSPGPGFPAGSGAVNPAGLDFYSRLVDDAARARHRTGGHAVPLGPAAVRCRTRAAGPNRDTADAVRRLRRARRRARSATASRRSRRSTSRGAPPSSATPRGEHAPGHPRPPPRYARRTTCSSAHGLARRRAASRAAADAEVSITLNPAHVPAGLGPRRPTSRRRADADRSQPVLPGPVAARAAARRPASTTARHHRLVVRAATATWRPITRADRLPRRQLLHTAPRVRRRPRPGRAPAVRWHDAPGACRTPGRRRTPAWAGAIDPASFTELLSAARRLPGHAAA